MSMCHVGYRTGTKIGVSYLHYATGILDWSKFHCFWEPQHREAIAKFADVPVLKEFEEERTALDAKAKLGFDPSLHLDGCELEAGNGGFWQTNTRKAEAAWRRNARNINDRSGLTTVEDCALFLDFNRHHAIIRYRGYCSWEKFLPDGWTYEFDEKPR